MLSAPVCGQDGLRISCQRQAWQQVLVQTLRGGRAVDSGKRERRRRHFFRHHCPQCIFPNFPLGRPDPDEERKGEDWCTKVHQLALFVWVRLVLSLRGLSLLPLFLSLSLSLFLISLSFSPPSPLSPLLRRFFLTAEPETSTSECFATIRARQTVEGLPKMRWSKHSSQSRAKKGVHPPWLQVTPTLG